MATLSYMLIKEHVIAKIKNNLPTELTYHCLAHTLDVLKQAQIIAQHEGITNPEDLFILKVAALYHDSGFIYTYQDHESKGCEIARLELPDFGFTAEQIDRICGLICATKIPQSPQNHLEQILCDADLDYLGRDDFSCIAHHLFQELLHFKKIANEDEWNLLQVKFLDKHKYFTAFSQQNREVKKQKHLNELKAKVSQPL